MGNTFPSRHAFLSEEDRPAVLQLDGDGGYEEQRREQHEEQRREHDVAHALDEVAPLPIVVVVVAQKRRVQKILHRTAPAYDVPEFRDEVKHLLQREAPRRDALAARAAHAHQHDQFGF